MEKRRNKMEIFDYYLPKQLIAQYPLKEREKARLMILNREKKEIKEGIFEDIVNYLRKGDTLVLNDSKVIRARLRGFKITGGKVEIFLLKNIGNCKWNVLLRGNIREGQVCKIKKNGKAIFVKILEKMPEGSYIVEFETDDEREIYQYGEIPLPPYIKRKPEKDDEIFYQTVYAQKDGSVAAPTAGLHFTGELLERIKKLGVNIVYITLHIGWASFKLLKGEKEEVGEEYTEISEEAAYIINRTKQEKGRVIAAGTSTVRALESSVDKDKIIPVCKYTDLFIKTGFRFKVVDGLITNFHLPGSTHLHLVCAFAGTEFIKKAYMRAVEKKYKFYSYGDGMLIL